MNMATELTTRRIRVRNYIDRLDHTIHCPDCGGPIELSGGKERGGRCLRCDSFGKLAGWNPGEIWNWHTTPFGRTVADQRQRDRDYTDDRQAQTAPF